MSGLSERLKKILDAKVEEDTEMIGHFEKIATKDDYVFLALIASYVGVRVSPSKYVQASLGVSEEFGVESILEEIKEKTDCKNLFLLINSPGGFVSTSYKIAKALRDHFEKIIVFIPHVAASGGTLIALSGNEIVMGTMSSLSPIDPSNGDSSAQSIIRGFQNVEDYFKDKSKADASYPYQVLAEGYDAAMLDQAYSSIALVVRYATEILNLVSKEKDNETSTAIAGKLVNGFLLHEEVVNAKKAQEVGLPIKKDSDYKEEWQLMRTWLGKYLLQSSDKHIIRYYISNGCQRKREVTNEQP